jgi:predicted ArsR family transcriptional regulator
VRVLADGLTADGYAASARPVPGGMAMQLCQGHCPVQDVAHEFPALCEAEARAFSRLLGVHVQRLATLAGGGHVCTTSIPLTISTHTPHAPAHPALSVEGQSA